MKSSKEVANLLLPLLMETQSNTTAMNGMSLEQYVLAYSVREALLS